MRLFHHCLQLFGFFGIARKLQRILSFFIHFNFPGFQHSGFLAQLGILLLQLINLTIQLIHLIAQLTVLYILHLNGSFMHRLLRIQIKCLFLQHVDLLAQLFDFIHQHADLNNLQLLFLFQIDLCLFRLTLQRIHLSLQLHDDILQTTQIILCPVQL